MRRQGKLGVRNWQRRALRQAARCVRKPERARLIKGQSVLKLVAAIGCSALVVRLVGACAVVTAAAIMGAAKSHVVGLAALRTIASGLGSLKTCEDACAALCLAVIITAACRMR